MRLHPAAVGAFRRLERRLRDRVRTAIDELAGRPQGATKLAGRDDYRIRVSDYRIVYAVDDEARVVIVAKMAYRRQVYRR